MELSPSEGARSIGELATELVLTFFGTDKGVLRHLASFGQYRFRVGTRAHGGGGVNTLPLLCPSVVAA